MKKDEKKVLVIDNSDAILQNIRFILEQQDYNVYIAHNAFQGLILSEYYHFDLIITDGELSNFDAIRFIQHLRHKLDQTPILILISDFKCYQYDLYKQAGATGEILKPFSYQKLLTEVERACS